MAASALVMDRAFNALHLVPIPNPNAVRMISQFSIDYTFWLNLLFGAIAVWFVVLDRRNPMGHACHTDEAGAAHPPAEVPGS